MVVLSAALLVGAVWLGRQLVQRYGAWSATLIAAGAYVVAVAVVMLILPTIDETPDAISPPTSSTSSACTRWARSLCMWATIAVVFASMAGRLLGETRRQESIAA